MSHPGIVFRPTPTGARLAALADGPDVVEVDDELELRADAEERLREQLQRQHDLLG